MLKLSIIDNLKSTFNLKDLNTDEIILYHHLGLGDHIICNGLVNYISNNFRRINIVVNDIFIDQIKYLYSENQVVNLLPVNVSGVNNADEAVASFSIENNLDILKIGFEAEKNINKPFYKAFYKQLKIPYRVSYKYFKVPIELDHEEKLFQHLMGEFNTNKRKYILFHNEASDEKFELNFNTKLPVISLSQEHDIFNNMFYYRKVILNASEIHCINSSFVHYIDRIDTKGKLFYHDIRGSRIKLKKKWSYVNYEN